jgi:cell division septal protein FtsQ
MNKEDLNSNTYHHEKKQALPAPSKNKEKMAVAALITSIFGLLTVSTFVYTGALFGAVAIALAVSSRQNRRMDLKAIIAVICSIAAIFLTVFIFIYSFIYITTVMDPSDVQKMLNEFSKMYSY